jgi:DNA-binding NarL/FixJ family response regulator
MAGEEKPEAFLHVVVVDDEKDTRLYFQDILQGAGDFKFAGEFSNGAEALSGIPSLHPDLVLMDIRMPDFNGIECTRRLKRAMPDVKVIIVTGSHDENSVQRALQAGAKAYLVKPVDADQCLATLRFVAVQPEIGGEEVEKFTTGFRHGRDRDNCVPLSSREQQVLACLAEGLLYKEISSKLGISFSAVHKYQHNIFRKLHVMNRTEAIRLWLNSQ